MKILQEDAVERGNVDESLICHQTHLLYLFDLFFFRQVLAKLTDTFTPTPCVFLLNPLVTFLIVVVRSARTIGGNDTMARRGRVQTNDFLCWKVFGNIQNHTIRKLNRVYR